MNLLLILTLVFLPFTFTKECYVEPCTRDIVITLDNTESMESERNSVNEVSFVETLTKNWTLSSETVRVALFGFSFNNDYQYTPYYTTSSTLTKQLSQLKFMTQHFGLGYGSLSECLSVLYSYYVKGKQAPARQNIQKRLIVFTSETNITDINLSAPYTKEISNAGYQLSLIPLKMNVTSFKNLTYHSIIQGSFPMLELQPSNIMAKIINDQICFNDPGVTNKPETCTTLPPPTILPNSTVSSTTITTIKPPIPTSDYLECSCEPEGLYTNIVICLDNSLAMGDTIYEVQANMDIIISQWTFDQSQKQSVRAALITFNQNAELVVPFDSYNSSDAFSAALWQVQYTAVDKANVKSCLQLASFQFSQTNRPEAPKAILIYSSAYSHNVNEDPRRLAATLKESGIYIITVAVDTDDASVLNKVGELASPHMNFTTEQHDETIDVKDALCQVNCFCPEDWHQLIINDRKYGECYQMDTLGANWLNAKHVCENMESFSYLVYINSQEKNEYLYRYAKEFLADLGYSSVPPEFHIGLNHNGTEYQWVTVDVFDITYFNWDIGYPDLSKGSCVRALEVNQTLYWRNEQCVNVSKGMCMSNTCDTRKFCSLI